MCSRCWIIRTNSYCELIEKGFEVVVYEKHHTAGGMARSERKKIMYQVNIHGVGWTILPACF